MRILVIGAGAVGGYFGARLHDAGRDVTFLVREKRAEQLRQTGLHVRSPFGDLHVQPKLLLASELRANPQTFDLILLSTKAYSLDAAMEDFAPAVGAQTAILPLLNGMQHLDRLDARFGPERVLGGSTRIVADLDEEGRVLNLERLHDLVFGERDKTKSPRIVAISAALRGAHFDDQLSGDVLAFMWQKWVFLAALAGLTCLMRGSIGDINAVCNGEAVSLAFVEETAAVAAAEGYSPSREFLDSVRARLCKKDSLLTASMFRDLQKNAPVEADQILGDMLRRADVHGVSVPLLRAAYVQLSIYSRKLQQAH